MATSAGWKSRARCAPIRCCSASTSRPPASIRARAGELNELLLSIRDEHGTSILLIEHDMSVVMEISDHVVVLDYGVKISDGTPAEVRNDPKVIARLSRRRGRRGRARSTAEVGHDATAPRSPSAASRPTTATSSRCSGVDIDVNDGEIVTLIGANGAGKSTLMMTIFGNPRAREGHDHLRRPRHHPACRPTRSRACGIAQSPEGRAHLPAHDACSKTCRWARRSLGNAHFDARPRAHASRCSRASRSACASAAARCRAASSRCWRSRAR